MNLSRRDKTRYAPNGFSLIEIITILFIVSLGLVGILSLIIQNIQSQSYNKDNLIAYQLAQEGVELIRAVRDSNWRTASPKPFIIILGPGDYYMDYNDSAPTHYQSGHPEQLVLSQDANGYYYHAVSASNSAGKFSRLIHLANGPDNSVRVTVDVTWTANNHNNSYDLETIIYNWK